MSAVSILDTELEINYYYHYYYVKIEIYFMAHIFQLFNSLMEKMGFHPFQVLLSFNPKEIIIFSAPPPETEG